MARTKISEYSATAADNTDINSINIAEGCAPSGINNAIREMMKQLKDFQAGTSGDSFTNSNVVLTGGSINGTTIGASTASTGAFTNLSYTGTLTGSTGVLNIGSGQIYKDASGNVGLGNTSPNFKLENTTTADNGNNTEYSQTRYAFGNRLAPCYITAFREAFSVNSAIVFHSNSNQGLTPTERMRLTSAGNLLVGTTSATSGGAKLQTADGITFPATQVPSANANTLDDYEEGTWTVTLAASTTNPSVTYGARLGTYTKIGRVVYATFFAEITAVSSQGSGNLRIAGLPFANASGFNQENGCVFYQASAFGFTGLNQLTGRGISDTQILVSDLNSNGLAVTKNTGSLQAGFVAGQYIYIV